MKVHTLYFSDQTREKFAQNRRRFLPDTKRTKKQKFILASVASGFKKLLNMMSSRTAP